MLLPPSLDELVPENHLVRIVNGVIDRLNNSILEELFKGGGAPSYHPKMMLKVIIYGYCSKLYSCRDIAKAIRQDITFMWVSGMQRPDFNTVNRFRSVYLKPVIEKVFVEVLDFLLQAGYIKFEDYFVDGTKIEASAGKYTHVWKKNTKRYKKQLKSRVAQLLEEIDEINDEEERIYGDRDLEELGEESEINSDQVQEFANRLDAKLKDVHSKKKYIRLNSRSKKLVKESEKLLKYEKQERLLGKRNSYSKTDPDATFMRMKNDLLRAGYNILIGTEGQFILNYSVSQNAADSTGFTEHLKRTVNRGASYIPKNCMGDAGIGNEENYVFLDEYDVNNYLKFNTFHYENTKKAKENKFRRDNFPYDEKKDQFICPAGKRFLYKETVEKKKKTGYVSELRIYECEDCSNCTYKNQCTRAKGSRKIQISPKLEKYKEQVRLNLNSEKGISLRKRRGYEVETPFGDWKQNQRFKRFHLRGMANVDMETGYLSIAYNLRKIYQKQINKKAA